MTPPGVQPQRVPLRVSNHGLTLLYQAESPNSIVVDIVFVHGLQGHPYKTWRFKGKVEEEVPIETAKPPKKFGLFQKKPEKGRLFWPADLLPNDIANARM